MCRGIAAEAKCHPTCVVRSGFVQDLKTRQGKDICLMGGGEFTRSMFEAGLHGHSKQVYYSTIVFPAASYLLGLAIRHRRQAESGDRLLIVATHHKSLTSWHECIDTVF